VDPTPYAGVLADFVDDEGLVDYEALKEDPRLGQYLGQLACLDPAAYATWADAAKIAFWLNAYNACTLKVIVDYYPIEAGGISALTYPANSIRQINGVWKAIVWPIMGDLLTLDHMEHGILREEFEEPRIHAALVCAALSCPPLRREPYTAEALETQLDSQMRHWLGQTGKFEVDREEGIVYLSKVFDWFGSDFVARHGDNPIPGQLVVVSAVLQAIMPHVDDGTVEYLQNGNYTVKYLDYDWTLNEQ
jgi:hypothetical protein